MIAFQETQMAYSECMQCNLCCGGSDGGGGSGSGGGGRGDGGSGGGGRGDGGSGGGGRGGGGSGEGGGYGGGSSGEGGYGSGYWMQYCNLHCVMVVVLFLKQWRIYMQHLQHTQQAGNVGKCMWKLRIGILAE